ncbi:MAG TPA: hypothetical protein VIG99_31555 [Myxococcaceae bacterium]|jgi:hypothetical protein
MRPLCVLLALLLAPFAACVHVPAPSPGAACGSADGGTPPAGGERGFLGVQLLSTDGDGVIQDTGQCEPVRGGTNLSPCHWHFVSVAADPGTGFARAIAEPGVVQVPLRVELFPARWVSFQLGTGLGKPFWPSPLSVAARLHLCGDEGCGWFYGGYWEPWRKSAAGTDSFVLGGTFGYRFESHFNWSTSTVLNEAWGPHLFAAPALSVDLYGQGPNGAPVPLAARLAFELGWSF